jgi:hypothetical protein
MSEEARERVARARLNEEKHPELLDALEAAEEDGTMAEVVREALRAHLLGDSGSEDTDGLSATARKGLRTLRNHVGGQCGEVEVGVAKSTVAAATNIKKEFIRSAVFTPLRREGYIQVSSRVTGSFIIILQPGASDDTDEGDAGIDEDEADLWKQQEPTTEETLRKYRRAGIEPPKQTGDEAREEIGADWQHPLKLDWVSDGQSEFSDFLDK